jgi:hypothetical protein
MSSEISKLANEGGFDERISRFVASRFGARAQQNLMLWLLQATRIDRKQIYKVYSSSADLVWQYRGAITACRIVLELLRSDIPVYLPPLDIDIFHAVDLIAGPFPNVKMAGIQVKTGSARWTIIDAENAAYSQDRKKVMAGCTHILCEYSLDLVPVMLSIPCMNNMTDLSTNESRNKLNNFIMKSIPKTPRIRRAS